MKAFIYKTNQYLLERYPTIWNTRLIWMLLAAVLLHLIFFVFGFFSLTNPKILHERNITTLFFDNGTVFLSSIISILLFVAWLIYMFKNNAFKNFYPTTRLKLFGQFMCYLLIIFSISTFYLSYNYGIKTYVAANYPDEQINKEIEITNDVALFLSEDVSDYTIDKRRYPNPFNTLFCEDQERFIDEDLPHLKFLDEVFQFYTLSTKVIPINDRNRYTIEQDSAYSGYVFKKTQDSLVTFYFKDSVVDMQPLVKSVKPSYYNASFTLFVSMNDTLKTNALNYNYNYAEYSDYDGYDYNYRPEFNLRHQIRSKKNQELLNRNDKNEIKKLMDDFLAISNAYKIDHNLTSEQWLDLVYHPGDFEVKHFIRTLPKDEYEYARVAAANQTEIEKFYLVHRSDYHYNNDALKYTFENIEEIKVSNPLADSIHFFLWFSFFVSCIVFMFRVTGLKPLLFSIITTGVLILFITLMTALIFYLIRGSDNLAFYFISYITLLLGTVILAIPLFFAERIKKLVVAICVNISIAGFPLYLFLILGIISMHQRDSCRLDPEYYKPNFQCHTIFDVFELNWSYVLYVIAIAFIFFYSRIIKQWKSLPEG